MGGSVGHIHLQVDNPYAQAGTQISGVVHLSVSSHIVAECLCLKFSGKEHCKWTINTNDPETAPITYQGDNVVIRQILPVFFFQNGQLAPGQYSFPFAFNTAANLPGSFDLSQTNTKAYIKYHLTAFLQTEAKVKKSKIDMRMCSALTQAIISVNGSVTTQVSTWGCVGKGRVGLAVNVNKNAYVPGEMAEIGVNVNNSQSQLEVTGVTWTLIRIIRLRSSKGESSVIKSTVNTARLNQSIRPGENFEGANQLHLSLSIFDSSGLFQTASTVRGRSVECIYLLNLKADMNGMLMCCGQPPALEHEVTIYPPQLAPALPPPIPQGWSPQVMPMAMLQQ